MGAQGSNKSIGSLIASKQANEASIYGHETVYGGGGGLPGERSPRSAFGPTHSRNASALGFSTLDPYAPSVHGAAMDGRSMMSGFFGGGGGATPSLMGFGGGNGAGSVVGFNPYGAPGMSNSGFFNVDPVPSGQMMAFGHQQQQSQGGAGSMLGMEGFLGGGNGEDQKLGKVPGDDQIIADVRSSASSSIHRSIIRRTDDGVVVLASSDLNSITKKGVRQQLESAYGSPLSAEQKAFVNQAIEDQLNL